MQKNYIAFFINVVNCKRKREKNSTLRLWFRN